MATHPNGQPAPEHKPRFSPEIVSLGNTIFDGISAFDEKTLSVTVRLIKSAQAVGTLTHHQTFQDLPKELQSYLMFRVHDEEQKEKDYQKARTEDEASRIAAEDEKYRVKYDYKDTDQPELIKNENGEWVRKDFL
jgi:hypothetical protein